MDREVARLREKRAFPLSLGYTWTAPSSVTRSEAPAKFDLCTCTTRAELDVLKGYATGVPVDWFPTAWIPSTSSRRTRLIGRSGVLRRAHGLLP